MVHWFLVTGGLFLVMALAGSVLKRLPLSASLLYLGIGALLGPGGLGMVQIEPVQQAAILERIAEVAVLISLFSAGLKLRTPLSDGRWRLPVRLATVSMLITIGLLTLVGVYLLGLPVGAAVLLGAILAPTDPVLAADVQVTDPFDQDRLRFSLTGEAGLNDGTAFPFVLLGLGLLGLRDLGLWGRRWLVLDVLWGVPAGVAVGWALGSLTGRLVLYLRSRHREALGLDDFLGLGLIGLSYGAADLVHGYGFLAVFAAGLALRRIERQRTGDKPPVDVRALALSRSVDEIATDPARAPAYMAQALLSFTEQLERMAEVAVVLLVGGMLARHRPERSALWLVPLLFLVVRPLSVWLGLLGARAARLQRALIAWFGLRGIGSVYYLAYATGRGLPRPLADRLTSLTLTVLAISVVAHGISVTPLMNRYGRLVARGRHERHRRRHQRHGRGHAPRHDRTRPED